MNQHDLATVALDTMIHNLSGEQEVEVIVLDNGSDTPFQYPERTPIHPSPTLTMKSEMGFPESEITRLCHTTIVRYEKSIGVYPTFWEGMKHANGDVLAFFHSDLIIYEKDWDLKVLDRFVLNQNLGLVGFIGSNEIDSSGGRGSGTCSNFQGNTVSSPTNSWHGSPAGVHGSVTSGFVPSAVVDGCAMIFRRSCLSAIKQRPEFPPHHFYDRLLSCETMEKGYSIGTIGIECDHISGQTVNQEKKYDVMAREWAESHGFNMAGVHNWDSVIYLEAERQWLTEYRYIKHFIPIKI